MASRPTQRNTRGIYARPGTEPSGPSIAIAPRGPGAAAARLLPVAAAVAVSPRAVRAISPRVIHAVSPRAVRAISLIARYDDTRAKPTHARALRRRRRSLARSIARARCGGYLL